MRKIMPDFIRDYEVYANPTSENRYTAKIPEPASTNVGKTGFFGVADRVFSPRHKFQATIENSGGLRPRANEAAPYTYPSAGRFTIKPVAWKNGTSDHVDSYCGMGGEGYFAISRCGTISTGSSSKFHSMRMIELEHHHNKYDDYGVIGFAVVGKWNGVNSSNFYYSWIVEGGPDNGYYRLDSLTQTSSLYSITSAYRPSLAICEFTDGSIFLAVDSGGSTITIYRTVDLGITWVRISSFSFSATTSGEIFMTRINERLVVVQNMVNAGTSQLYTAYSDDFGYTWTNNGLLTSIASGSSWHGIDICKGQDGKLYMVYTFPDGGGSEKIYFSGTLDGCNWDTPVKLNVACRDVALIQDYTGLWILYVVMVDGANYEICCYTETTNDPINGSWAGGGGGWVTNETISADVSWEHICARFMNKNGYISMMASFNYSGAGGGAFENSLTEMQLGMWSGYPMATNGSNCAWDVSWIANHYPTTSDSEPHNNKFTRLVYVGGASALTLDGLNMTRTGSGSGDIIIYRYTGSGSVYYLDTGFDLRFELAIASGTFVVNFVCRGTGSMTGCNIYVIFKRSNNTVVVYDYISSSTLKTYTCVNWNLGQSNVFHITVRGSKLAIFRSGDTYNEVLHLEQFINQSLTSRADPGMNVIDFKVIQSPIDDETTDATIKNFFINKTGSIYPLTSGTPYLDQDRGIIGRFCYYKPIGYVQGLACQFDGKYVVEYDKWYMDVGAIYEPENLLIPSPSVGWKTNTTTPADQNLYFRRKADYLGNSRRKLAYGIAFFGKNWLSASILTSVNGSSWQTLSTNATHWYLQKGIATDTSRDNIILYTPPTAGLYEGQFSSTPEMSYYVMPLTGTLAYKIMRIIDCDDTMLVVDENVGTSIAKNIELVIFSDRIYLDIDSLTYKDTRYLALTIAANGYTFPDADDGLVKLGSVCFGPIYNLPDNEWTSQMTYDPIQSVFESRGSLKEVVNLSPARRKVSLQYTGIEEPYFGKSQPLDLARITQWGVYPIVYLDDASILETPNTNRAHHDPLLARVSNGVQVTREAFNQVTETQGHGTNQTIIKTISTISFDLEEIL